MQKRGIDKPVNIPYFMGWVPRYTLYMPLHESKGLKLNLNKTYQTIIIPIQI